MENGRLPGGIIRTNKYNKIAKIKLNIYIKKESEMGDLNFYQASFTYLCIKLTNILLISNTNSNEHVGGCIDRIQSNYEKLV